MATVHFNGKDIQIIECPLSSHFISLKAINAQEGIYLLFVNSGITPDKRIAEVAQFFTQLSRQ